MERKALQAISQDQTKRREKRDTHRQTLYGVPRRKKEDDVQGILDGAPPLFDGSASRGSGHGGECFLSRDYSQYPSHARKTKGSTISLCSPAQPHCNRAQSATQVFQKLQRTLDAAFWVISSRTQRKRETNSQTLGRLFLSHEWLWVRKIAGLSSIHARRIGVQTRDRLSSAFGKIRKAKARTSVSEFAQSISFNR